MAEVVQEKSRGLKFAEQQLLRHGWEQGKGLGRAENGISEPIKVKVKCDKGGVGHKEGEQFSFHWWDHVFNKASSSLQVETNQNGIKLKKTTDERDETISNKKPRKALLQRNKLYGCFVKSATLLSGEEQPEPKVSGSDDDSSSDEEEEEQNLDLSSTTKLSDSDLVRVCGGRTAHKGARHGLTMSAKLARLEQQEAEFMAKYGKKSQPTVSSSTCITTTPPTAQMEETEECHRKKMKKKRSREKSDEMNNDGVCNSPEVEVRPKKKKKKDETEERVSTEGDEVCMENQGESRSKRRENTEQNGDAERQELNSEVKKKKKKNKSSSCDAEPAESETLEKKEKKKRKKNKLSEKTVEEEESPLKKKSKDQ